MIPRRFLIEPDSVQLAPVPEPWRLWLPRRHKGGAVHGWDSAERGHVGLQPHELPGLMTDRPRFHLCYAWQPKRSAPGVAILEWADAHQLVRIEGDRVVESVVINPHLRALAKLRPRLRRLERDLRTVTLARCEHFPDYFCRFEAAQADHALAVAVAERVVRSATGDDAWLRRQLAGLDVPKTSGHP
jgi:hypothetical protein